MPLQQHCIGKTVETAKELLKPGGWVVYSMLPCNQKGKGSCATILEENYWEARHPAPGWEVLHDIGATDYIAQSTSVRCMECALETSKNREIIFVRRART